VSRELQLAIRSNKTGQKICTPVQFNVFQIRFYLRHALHSDSTRLSFAENTSLLVVPKLIILEISHLLEEELFLCISFHIDRTLNSSKYKQ
jgi:hypothetical protein